ncbi:hypothetical protein XENOCAPTIV_029970 [Xenoophorus captivus]|uniref:C2 domain-containing protein n=1 Tax=Xenoophorus captivus TaxID=1517983 RepID=A0ABV0QBU7_9TELE
MALSHHQQPSHPNQLAQAATLEQLRERLDRAAGGAPVDGPEKKMMRLAEEQQRLMQQALQQNLLAVASHFNPMSLKLNNGHGVSFLLPCFLITAELLPLDIFKKALTHLLHTFGTMPYHDKEYPGQPLWQSVLLFCCKGVIEGIMVVLFFWLLVLLLVGLIVFCLSLILGCVLCWKKSDICTAITNSFTPTQASVETVTPIQDPRSSDETTGSRQLCEELDGVVLEYPSTFTSPTPSESGHFSQAFSNQTQPASDENEQATSHFSLRRFSSPLQTAPLYKPIHPSRASLPLLPKLGMLTRKCKAMQRRCTVAGDYRSSDERSILTWSSMNSKLIPEKPIPLVPLSYGSSASCKPPLSKLCLHFTVEISLEQQTLTVTVLNLTGRPQRLEDVTVLGCLPPLYTCPSPATTQSSCNPESNSLVLILKVSSLNELKNCELRLALYVPKEQSQRATALGEVVVKCGERDWRSEHSFHFIKELDQNNVHIEKVCLF